MTGVKNKKPLGFRRIRALAAGEVIDNSDNSGDVDIGRTFEAVVLDYVKDCETNEPVEFKTDSGFPSYIYKIRIEEKSDETRTGNEFFIDPSRVEELSEVIGSFFENEEQAKNCYINFHPEGVYISDDPAKEIPKIGDTVVATSEKIQGRYIITAKFGSAANKQGGYKKPVPNKHTKARELVNFGGNGVPVSGYPQVFLKENSVKWNCLDPDVKKGVLEIAEKTGLPITVTAGYRSKEENDKVGSSDKSQHRFGQAVDIRTRDKTNDELNLMEEAALQAGFKKPPKLVHGTAEHFHFEYPANKNQISKASEECAEQIIAAFEKDPAKGTKKA